ncbi:hypothetical protein [Psittacicella gerlachiana]|uniref:Uncharacterized protein n=1 Tax=Psittacicella gerlachiana TaxID=2028574 RepID=A0A3A1YGR6_9GAMM|nr:hypothetical protein [Psittacicella gerlachiana]RIY35227.1 hypothetical protein CKF59_03915 [Psittacicella gerlachiana]
MSKVKFYQGFDLFSFDALALEVDAKDQEAFKQFLQLREQQFQKYIQENPIFFGMDASDPTYKKARLRYLGTLLSIQELIELKFKE